MMRHLLLSVRPISDFEAVAWSLPRLSRDKLPGIAGRQPVVGAPPAALGPGTGPGMAVSIVSGNGLENLHEALAALDDVMLPRRRAAIDMLRAMLGTVAGAGLRTLAEVDGIG